LHGSFHRIALYLVLPSGDVLLHREKREREGGRRRRRKRRRRKREESEKKEKDEERRRGRRRRRRRRRIRRRRNEHNSCSQLHCGLQLVLWVAVHLDFRVFRKKGDCVVVS
jgi:hypothetical protein